MTSDDLLRLWAGIHPDEQPGEANWSPRTRARLDQVRAHFRDRDAAEARRAHPAGGAA